MNPELKSTLQSIAEILNQRSESFSIAESCTGGLVSSYVTSISGSSKYYWGAVVSYQNSVKESLLNVSSSLLQSVGAVSLPVAKAMAYGVKKQLNSHWGLSVTGIAGPGGGSLEKPVGTVCFSWVGPGFEKTVLKKFGLFNEYSSESSHEQLKKPSRKQLNEPLNESLNESLKREEVQEAAAIFCLTEFLKILMT